MLAMDGVPGASLSPIDWVVIGLYFALLAGSGAYFARRAKQAAVSSEGYFTAGHAMPVWAVAISILATAQSAATFTGVPEQAYLGNIAYLATNVGGLIAAIVLATVFIPAFYRNRVTTPYQLLERRFGPGAKLAASWAYMIGRVLASGSRVYIGAIPVAIAIWGDASPSHMALAIAAFMTFGVVYTLAGGISSVIWTDVLQVAVYLGAAAVVVVLLLNKISVPWSDVYAALSTGAPGHASKLTVFPTGFRPDGSFDWASSYNLCTILTGFVLITLASHGTDQDLVQRMLSCKSAAKGSLSVISGLLIGVPAVTLFLALGLLLWIFYHRPTLMGGLTPNSPPGESSKIVLQYILNELATTGTGSAGLMIAGVMAAGPAGINSGLNSMASTFVTDVYAPRFPGRSDAHYVRVSRIAVVIWGLILGAFALLCIHWYDPKNTTIIDFVLGVMNYAYAGLLGMFFTALFTRRGTTASAITALIVGAIAIFLMQFRAWEWVGFAPAPGENRFTLAFPWQLVIGATLATVICAAPAGTRSAE